MWMVVHRLAFKHLAEQSEAVSVRVNEERSAHSCGNFAYIKPASLKL